ncbi:MAG TPA: hypothetical protein VF120_14455 [Ktedonobacterales bacterium]
MARIEQFLHLDQAESKQLEEAQLRSLRAPRVQRPTTSSNHTQARVPTRGTARQVRGLLSVQPIDITQDTLATQDTFAQAHRLTNDDVSADTRVPGKSSRAPNGAHTPSLRGSREQSTGAGGVVRGRSAAMQFVLRLIEQAPGPRESSIDSAENTIVVTSLEHGEWNDVDRGEYLQRWVQVVRAAVQRGWHICHVVRLDQRSPRSLAFAQLVLQLVGAGRFTMLYVHAPELAVAPRELAIIPGVAAVVLLATQNTHAVDSALVLEQPDQIEVMQAFFTQMKARARPLVQTWPPKEWADFDTLRLQEQERFGGHVLVKDGLSLITEPPSWSSPGSSWARRTGHSGDALDTLIANRVHRIHSFESHVEHSQYRDICPMKAIERLVREGEYHADDAGKERLPTPVEERIEHLERVIGLLRTRDNYQLALVDDNEDAHIPILPNRFWEVAGNMRLFTSVPLADQEGQRIHTGVMIAESTIVGAVQGYFDGLWEGIGLRHRERTFVISWLEDQLASLR